MFELCLNIHVDSRILMGDGSGNDARRAERFGRYGVKGTFAIGGGRRAPAEETRVANPGAIGARVERDARKIIGIPTGTAADPR
mgnify:CR=1 FL=1